MTRLVRLLLLNSAELIAGTVAEGPDGRNIKITMPHVGSTVLRGSGWVVDYNGRTVDFDWRSRLLGGGPAPAVPPDVLVRPSAGPGSQ